MYGLTTHRRNHHENINENVSYPCDQCGNFDLILIVIIFFFREINCLFTFSTGNTYRSTLSLTNHIANVHEKVPCSICGEMISKKRETRHIQQKHTANCDKKFKCKYCGNF